MPPVLQLGARILCGHGGQVIDVMPSPRVQVGGAPALTQPGPFVVGGCPNASPPGPCVTAQWITASTRVLAGGQPLLLLDSAGICAPTGVPALPVVGQIRVEAE